MPKNIRIEGFLGNAGVAPAVSTGSSFDNFTGSWRYLKPLYDNKTAPCNDGCPNGNDIRGFIEALFKDELHKAYSLLSQTTPFPSICGRVCYHPCEGVCNRKDFDQAVSICSLERHVGDWALENARVEPVPATRSSRIAVIGAGPAGLNCAYHLALLGHRPVVFEREPKPGGMLRYGIPPFRLPKNILDDEIARIQKLGVQIQTGSRIGKQELEDVRKDFHAVFIAVGAYRSRPMKIPGEEFKGVQAGLEVLCRLNAGEAVKLGKHVVVVGGGNTAMDVARCAKRLGSNVQIVYRRTEAEMPAHPDEGKETLDESIPITFLAAPYEIIGRTGQVERIVFQRMKLGSLDSSGRRRPVPIEGSFFELEAQNVLTAIGESSETDFAEHILESDGSRFARSEYQGTKLQGVFIGGDSVADSKGTVVHAMGEGRLAAKQIHNLLTGESLPLAEKKRIVTYDQLNTVYFQNAERINIRHLSPQERADNFREVASTLSREASKTEASRCFACAVCNLCDNCKTFCPDRSINLVGKELSIDYDHCKGCGICVEECPRNAMSMVEEI